MALRDLFRWARLPLARRPTFSSDLNLHCFHGAGGGGPAAPAEWRGPVRRCVPCMLLHVAACCIGCPAALVRNQWLAPTTQPLPPAACRQVPQRGLRGLLEGGEGSTARPRRHHRCPAASDAVAAGPAAPLAADALWSRRSRAASRRPSASASAGCDTACRSSSGRRGAARGHSSAGQQARRGGLQSCQMRRSASQPAGAPSPHSAG